MEKEETSARNTVSKGFTWLGIRTFFAQLISWISKSLLEALITEDKNHRGYE